MFDVMTIPIGRTPDRVGFLEQLFFPMSFSVKGKNVDLLELSRRDGSNEGTQYMFQCRYMENYL